jgi:hypothetical protein
LAEDLIDRLQSQESVFLETFVVMGQRQTFVQPFTLERLQTYCCRLSRTAEAGVEDVGRRGDSREERGAVQ